ncbi:winged helix-turn-helix domain-containing protein [Sphingomonas edaphi]|uniref:winged helix-turn-helix domain-containing protein n=1 Tax=Sphingomonas edaphi TaxID=2315689 RepID=UPI001314977E|nr:winged helix-turn-helix domain-containing protein [Sphingomonas edaphi]
MALQQYRFEAFTLDTANRELARDGRRVELSARYFDALALMVSQPQTLMTKARLLDEVWNGVPVTDEALTQCIRTLRRALGDSATSPRFIETVPKHGYRFIGQVDGTESPVPLALSAHRGLPRPMLVGAAGTIGGGLAGVLGGIIYGFLAASQPLQAGLGGASVLLVLIALTTLVGLIGGAGVSFGIAAADSLRSSAPASIAGGAVGGLLVGAIVKLLGLDAFSLLLGQSPGNITGAYEGALLGAAAGIGAWLAGRWRAQRLRRSVAASAAVGATTGLLIILTGGRLMAGSLDLLSGQFPASRLRFDHLGRLLGDDGFGPWVHAISGALEGMLFIAFVAAAIGLARRQLSDGSS